MTDQAGLERGYRRLLACYPRSFRQENTDEVVAVLLATARDGQRRPGVGESADLLRGALRMHLGLSRSPRTVLAAIRLMYLGAAVEIASLLIMVVTAGQVRAAVLQHGLGLAAWHTALTHIHVGEAAAPVVLVLWLALAWSNGRGYDWARYLLGAFFCLITLSMLSALAQGGALYATADFTAGGVLWVIALVAATLVFNRRSDYYYSRQTARQHATR